MPVPVPNRDAQYRLAVIAHEAGINALDPILDALASTAAAVCEVPIAHLTLSDEDHPWMIGSVGLSNLRTLLAPCIFSEYMATTGRSLLVPDASQDVRFAQDIVVTGPLDIQFFAGVPIRSDRGETMGSLCVVDHVPRRLARHQLQSLRWLANIATGGLGSHEEAMLAIEQAPRKTDYALQVGNLLHVALADAAEDGRHARTVPYPRRVTEPPYQLPNPSRLALDDPGEVLLWADDFALTTTRLREIVAKVGPMRAAVRAYVNAQRRAAISVVTASPDCD